MCMHRINKRQKGWSLVVVEMNNDFVPLASFPFYPLPFSPESINDPENVSKERSETTTGTPWH